MIQTINNIINLDAHEVHSQQYQSQCKSELDEHGVLKLDGFLSTEAVDAIKKDGDSHAHLAYYTQSSHNVYLAPKDESEADSHPRNRHVVSSKGCITTDQIPHSSALHELYNDDSFKFFLCAVLGEQNLHEYADPLSSINLHYAAEGQELGWHFDNSSFAITLLIQKPDGGGVFEYVKSARNADAGEMNFPLVEKVLDAQTSVDTLAIEPGDLVLFRGRNALHRVTPTIGDVTRMLVVLAYNTEPGIALSESARQTFYGRLA